MPKRQSRVTRRSARARLSSWPAPLLRSPSPSSSLSLASPTKPYATGSRSRYRPWRAGRPDHQRTRGAKKAQTREQDLEGGAGDPEKPRPITAPGSLITSTRWSPDEAVDQSFAFAVMLISSLLSLPVEAHGIVLPCPSLRNSRIPSSEPSRARCLRLFHADGVR